MLAVGLSYVVITMLRYIPFTPNLLRGVFFYHERMLKFVKGFSVSTEMVM